MIVPGSPSDLNIGNGTEVAMVCTGLGSLFYFLCSNLKANPVVMTDGTYCPSLPKIQMITSNVCFRSRAQTQGSAPMFWWSTQVAQRALISASRDDNSLSWLNWIWTPQLGVFYNFKIMIRGLFWGSSLQHPQALLGCVRTSRIQSLTLKPVLADPACWWREEEPNKPYNQKYTAL